MLGRLGYGTEVAGVLVRQVAGKDDHRGRGGREDWDRRGPARIGSLFCSGNGRDCTAQRGEIVEGPFDETACALQVG